jgi:Flp pilus assembly protein TadD
MLGSIQMDLGKFAEAEKNLRLAHKVYPEYPNPLLNLGKLSEEKNPRAAVTYYLAALKYATPQTTEILLFNLGVLYQKHGNLRKAEEYYRELLKRNPASILPCRNLAILLLNKNDLSGAETLLRKAWLAEKNNPERVIDLAYVLLTAGKKEQAKELLRELLRKDPANQPAKELWNSVEPQSRK